MRNLIVSLMNGKEVLEERMVEGTDGWIERYQTVCKQYVQAMMTNDNLEMRVRITYEPLK